MVTCPETVGISSASCCDFSEAVQLEEAPACRSLPACTAWLPLLHAQGASPHGITGGAGMPPRPYGAPPMGMPMHAGHPGGPGGYGTTPGAMGGMPPQGEAACCLSNRH